MTTTPFDPSVTPQLYEGVLTKRVMAFFIDLAFMGAWLVIGYLVLFLLALPTLGLSLILLGGVLWALVYFLYIGLTMGGQNNATPGMRIMGLEAVLWHGEKPGFIIACFHALLFWLSFFSFVLFVSLIFALFSAQKRTLHDLVSGVIVINKRG
jgi:uncharacterized RDD family membrane protein YckC